MCRVTYETNRHLEKQAKQEKFLQYFEDDMRANYLDDMERMIIEAKKVASNYNEYDFSEELDDMLKEIL